ncbi:MAG: hypothetical protein Q4A42_05000 [Tissierellia bacterium]|nr:hypothetical protein [Tissierellia bacterium]
MYISKEVLNKKLHKNFKYLILSVVMLLFFLSGIIGGLMGDDSLKEHMVVYIFFSVIFGGVVYHNYMNRKFLNRGAIYESVFRYDYDGYISIRSLSDKIGSSEGKIIREIDKLIKCGILQKCSIDIGNMQVVLQGVEKKDVLYRSIECQRCGGITKVRVGWGAKCDYCGSEIYAKFED